eukprot:g25966.t1
MQVTLTQPVAVDEVDAEIVVVEGCALGFVAPGQPPHVLHVDPGQPAKHGVQSDDLLLSIDGQLTAQLSQEKVAELLRSAKILVFERPQGAADGEDNCCFLKLVESNIFGGDLAMAFLILMHSLRLVEHYLSWLIHTYSSCQNEFFRKDTEPPSDEDPAKAADGQPVQAGKERSRSRRGRRHRESKHEDKQSGAEASRHHPLIFPEALAEEDAFEAAVAVLPRRGPDAQGTEVVDLPDAHLELQACVLHLRGEAVTAQPLLQGGQLLFNGEIYESSRGGSDSLDLSSSDTCWLARQLANCEVISDGADKLTLALRDLLETLHGPFAMAFWSPKCHALFVARDRLGRRSLLAARTASGVGVASVGSSVSWQELPVTGVFVFDLVARSVRQLPWRQPAPFAQPWWWSTDNACDEANLRLAFGRLLSEAVARRVEHVAAQDLLRQYGPERFRLVLSDIRQEDLLAEEISICRLLGPKATHLDFNIAAALWFAARGRGLLCSPDFVSQPWWAPTAASSLQLEPSKPVKPAGLQKSWKVSCVTCVLPAKPGCPHLSCKLCCRKLHKASGEPKEWCPVHKIKAPSAEQPEAEPEAEVCIELSAQRCAHPEAEEIRASCRVLLVGTGADELLGGYSRHRTARAKRGADGTRSEMLKDLQRLWTRNLGRDDRIIADHGREARHPFLDDHLLEFVGRLPIELVAYGIGGESDPAPDKWLLRELASQRGLDACAQFKKRAIQFGTRIAKKSNIQHAGSRSLCKQASGALRMHGWAMHRRLGMCQALHQCTDPRHVSTGPSRINDPSTSDRNREQLQTILANIKDKINALTPVQKEDPAKRRPMPMRPLPYQTTLDNRPRPAVLQLSKLPEEMRGPDGEVQLRDALGDSVEWIREWSEDGSSCMVRFRDRRQAEAAIQDQKVWGFVAKIQDEAPHFRRKPPVHRFQPTRHMHKVFRPPRMDGLACFIAADDIHCQV